MIYHSNSTEESEDIGEALAEKLALAGKRRAFIAMRGEMGVGKTAFVRGFARHFGIKSVKSPTYSVVNEYKNDKADIFHFDMYRIETDDDLYSIAYDDYLERDAYLIVEWSENIEDFIPDDAVFVTISRVSDDKDARTIQIDFPLL